MGLERNRQGAVALTNRVVESQRQPEAPDDRQRRRSDACRLDTAVSHLDWFSDVAILPRGQLASAEQHHYVARYSTHRLTNQLTDDPLHRLRCYYSVRKAINGLTLLARHAGTYAAPNATAAMRVMASAKDGRSIGLSP
jgi:hypothetical protein